MKDTFTVIKTTITGLLVAVFVYPAIHECGHILATILTGGRLVALSWLPMPNVLCEVDSTNLAALAITSLAGMAFPMLFILPFFKSKGYVRLGALFFGAIIILSTIIDLYVAALNLTGFSMPNDDINTFIELTGMTLPATLIMVLLTGLSILLFLLMKPKRTLAGLLFPDNKPISETESIRKNHTSKA